MYILIQVCVFSHSSPNLRVAMVYSVASESTGAYVYMVPVATKTKSGFIKYLAVNN